MNFLSATRSQDGKWDAGGLVLDGPQSGHETLELAVRPEDVRLAENGFRAKVRIVEPLGPHQLVTCDIAGNSFRAVLDSDLRLTPGQDFAPALTGALGFRSLVSQGTARSQEVAWHQWRRDHHQIRRVPRGREKPPLPRPE